MTTSFESAPKKEISTVEDFKAMLDAEIKADYDNDEVDEATLYFESISNDPVQLAALFEYICMSIK